MNRFLTTLLLFSACLATGVASNPALGAEEGFSSLEEQMTGQEFEAAGLEKLSPQELASLNGWIRRHSLATLGASASATGVAAAGPDSSGTDQRGFKSYKGDRTPITSRILGSFSGWDGQTVFRLENGMIWTQADKDKFYIDAVENPAVVIEPRMFGRWELSIEGHDAECRVERIQ